MFGNGWSCLMLKVLGHCLYEQNSKLCMHSNDVVQFNPAYFKAVDLIEP